MLNAVPLPVAPEVPPVLPVFPFPADPVVPPVEPVFPFQSPELTQLVLSPWLWEAPPPVEGGFPIFALEAFVVLPMFTDPYPSSWRHNVILWLWLGISFAVTA